MVVREAHPTEMLLSYDNPLARASDFSDARVLSCLKMVWGYKDVEVWSRHFLFFTG
jgi:hypothetical protein